jgi:hypothetical protein
MQLKELISRWSAFLTLRRINSESCGLSAADTYLFVSALECSATTAQKEYEMRTLAATALVLMATLGAASAGSFHEGRWCSIDMKSGTSICGLTYAQCREDAAGKGYCAPR